MDPLIVISRKSPCKHAVANRIIERGSVKGSAAINRRQKWLGLIEVEIVRLDDQLQRGFRRKQIVGEIDGVEKRSPEDERPTNQEGVNTGEACPTEQAHHHVT